MPNQNRLIQSLPASDRARLFAAGELVDLSLSVALYEPDTPTRHVYFPVSGYVSLISRIDDGSALEVGMVGSEGMVGVHLSLGVTRSPLHALVQREGQAWRLSAAALRQQLDGSDALRRGIARYVAVLMAQLATSATCVRFHEIRPRLARWLLMSQDRARSTELHMTQEFLSYMLGVRRVGVTGAALSLHRDGLIAYHRGDLTIVDRPGLEGVACSCYAADRAVLARLSA